MIYNIIYYLIFLIFLTILFWVIEDSTINKFSTKLVEVDGQQYMLPDFTALEGDPKVIKSVGSKLVCEALESLTSQKVKFNRNIENSRSLLSGNPLRVDCTDISNGIAAGYKPYEFFTYKGKDNINRDVYEFYNRLALDASMKDSLGKQDIHYIDVPYTVDKCENVNGELNCSKFVEEGVRKKRIRNYLKNRLSQALG